MIRFHGERYDFHSWVIMPNHVHALFTPKEKIEKSIQAWKGVSAREIGQGSIWQRGYRDTLIRYAEHFRNAVLYIRRNPSKAKLRQGEYSLWESPRAAALGQT
jgi:putative transposase